MNRLTIKILFVVTIVAACQPTRDSKTENDWDTITAEQSPKVVEEDPDENAEKPKDWKEFKTIFAFSDKEVSQRLGITMLTNDSIDFRLLTEDNLCDTEYWGKARNFYPDGDPEIDEDDTNEAYEVSEFILEDSFKLSKSELRTQRTKPESNSRTKLTPTRIAFLHLDFY
jgi:hypothetical protein